MKERRKKIKIMPINNKKNEKQTSYNKEKAGRLQGKEAILEVI